MTERTTRLTKTGCVLFLILLRLHSSQASQNEFRVHEWGTFTSFAGSNGKTQSGMHHEEVGLPGFVYGLAIEEEKLTARSLSGDGRHCRNCKFATLGTSVGPSDLLPEVSFDLGVTQKMESPVLYFYGKPGTEFQVDVRFPQGMISQWYPEAARFERHSELKNGGALWKGTLLSTSTNDLPATVPSSIWNPARAVPEANAVAIGKEHEKFIFYRGLANFELPIQFQLSKNEIKTVFENSSAEGIHASFYEYQNGRAVFHSLQTSKVSAGSHSTLTDRRELKNDGEAVIREARSYLTYVLQQSGLSLSESNAMLNTWDKSYFRTNGPRILYILPRTWVDQILPIQITPTPKELVRVLIGRVELLSESDEKLLLDRVAKNQLTEVEIEKDRSLEPKLRRVLELAKTDALKKRINSLIERVR